MRKKSNPANILLIKKLIEDAGVSIHSIEKNLNIGKSIVLRGLKEESGRPLPQRWEQPIIKHLRKVIQEKKEVELQTTEVLEELGFKVPDKESGLQENEKEIKQKWFQKLHF